MLKLNVLTDPNYPIELAPICAQVNNIQNSFNTDFTSHNIHPGKNKINEIMAGDTLSNIARKAFYSTEETYAYFTGHRLEANFFAKRKANLTVFSTHDWEYYTDVPLEFGVAFFIARMFFRILRANHRFHPDMRGCPFDFKADKTDIGFGLKIGKLCGECQRAFENDRQVNIRELQAASMILNYTVERWRENKPFVSLDDPSGPGNDLIKWPFIPTQPSDFFESDLEKIRTLEADFLALEVSRNSASSQEKGKALEKFTKALFNCLSGFSLCGENLRLQDCEVDLSYRVDSQTSDLHRLLAPMILIECKNRQNAAAVQDISHHIVRLSHRNLKAGVFVSVGGITGYSPVPSTLRDSLSIIVEEYRQNDRLILPVVWEDILALRRGTDLHTMLNTKVNEIILR